jgi:hypothetical protein
MPYDFCSKNVKLNLANATAGDYTFDFSQLESFTMAINIKLLDHFTNQEITLQPGSTYTFSVTSDAISSGAERFEIQFAKPVLDASVSLSAFSNNICAEDGTQITVSGTQAGVTYEASLGETVLHTFTGNGSSLSFDVSASNLQAGANTFQLKAAFTGCAETVLPSTAVVNFTPKPGATIVGGILTSTAASGNQWLLEGNVIAGADDQTFVPTVSGEYTVVVTGPGCTLTSNPVVFNVTDVENGSIESFEVYPNPVINRFKVILSKAVKDGEQIEIQFVNALGQIIAKSYTIYSSNGVELDASRLGSGLYNLVIRSKNKEFESRIIKQ